jgi:hypothetical protein
LAEGKVKSALFVDFDNIYSGLRQLDQATADRFAREPMEWVSWMVNSLALPEHVTGGPKRRILVRRCYLNPQAYQRFRPFFNLAGFEIIDCPALTSGGKTSTDIHMVLDIIDLLQHEAHYDEFIVLSADADFTPVLRKLRRWDRRTTVLAIGFPSAAYRASADLVIDQDEFMRGALGMAKRDKPGPQKLARDAAPTSASIATLGALVRTVVAQAAAPVSLPSLEAQAVERIDGLDATWCGYGSFSALLQACEIKPLQVSAHNGGVVYDPARHGVPGEMPAQDMASPSADAHVLAELVRREVRQSAEPVACARLATSIARYAGATPADWYGNGTFRRFLESLDLAPLQFDWKEGGGIVYDPERHARAVAAAPLADQEWTGDAATLAMARQLHALAGVPLLAPACYRALFAVLSAEVAEHGYDFLDTAKRVRDRCREAGHPVSRADVDFVLRGLVFRGHRFEEHANGAGDLATKFANNVRSLCLREQIILDVATETAIRNWIGP